MLDRRDRGTWGGRGRGGGETREREEDWKHGVFLQRVEKRLLCVSHYFSFFSFFILCLYVVRVAEFEGSQRGIFWVIGSFVFAVVLRRESSFIVEVKKKKKKRKEKKERRNDSYVLTSNFE